MGKTKIVNWKEVPMTAGEIKEQEKAEKEIEKYLAENPPVPTPEERLTKLEEENAELRQALEILLGDGKAAAK